MKLLFRDVFQGFSTVESKAVWDCGSYRIGVDVDVRRDDGRWTLIIMKGSVYKPPICQWNTIYCHRAYDEFDRACVEASECLAADLERIERHEKLCLERVVMVLDGDRG